jgi:hypothetical protein
MGILAPTSPEPQALADLRRATQAVTAYHEAGHAVVASELGQDVYSIVVDEKDGAVCHRPRGEEPGLEDRLSIVLAGSCAEAMAVMTDLSGMPQLFEHWRDADDLQYWLDKVRDIIKCRSTLTGIEGDADEWKAAEIVFGVVPDGGLGRVLGRARDRARAILSREWADVQVIAECIGGDR